MQWGAKRIDEKRADAWEGRAQAMVSCRLSSCRAPFRTLILHTRPVLTGMLRETFADYQGEA